MLRELEPTLGPLDLPPVPLEGGITNHNFRATFAGKDYVLRRHGKDTSLLGIDRDAERIASETAATLGIGPPLAATLDGGLVTGFVSCHAAEPGELATHATQLGRALRSFHDSGVQLPARFWVPDLLSRYAHIVAERGGELPGAYPSTVAVARRIAAVLDPADVCPCHNDLLPGNVLCPQLMIVDWEYAGMGHPYFDLGNLAVNNDFDDDAEERLLTAYLGARPDDGAHATLKLMRILSDAREAAWGVVQASVSELDFDFVGYGERHFERLLTAASQPDFEEWLARA
jgi:thiamine kinase-like enzyme